MAGGAGRRGDRPPESAITDLARIAEAKSSFIKLGPGAQRHADAGQAFRAILCLPAVTGAWRIPEAAPTCTAQAPSRPGERHGAARPATAGQPDAVINQVQPGRAPGRHLRRPRTGRRLCRQHEPRSVVCPDSGSVFAGLARDLFTVVLEQFMTDTARYADVVLPATTQLEHLDVVKSWGHRYC